MNKSHQFEKIVLISLDTLRADCIPYNPVKRYLNEYKSDIKLEDSVLNNLFARGYFFNNVVSAAPYTSASHAAYFSGKWPKNNGLYDQFNSKLKARNIFQIFKEAGYGTSFKTDFPFILGKYLNIIQGVDNYFIEDDESPLEQLKSNGNQLTFFHFGQIHYPYGFHNLKYGGNDYKDKIHELERKYNIKTGSVELEDMAIESFRDTEDLELLYRYKKILSHLYKNRMDNVLFNLYLEGINYFHKHKLNQFLEKLLDTLKNKNYLLIIFADHGEAWNDKTYGHHNSMDEGVLKVPILFLTKNIKSKMYSNRIRSIDLTPTLNQFLEPNNYTFDGKSLNNIIFNNDVEEDRTAFSAVWVNESHKVLKNIKRLMNKDNFRYDKSMSIKYAACIYDKEWKYVEQYKIFSGRSEKLTGVNENYLFKITSDQNLVSKRNTDLQRTMRTQLNELNDVRIQNNETPQDIRKYLRLQGYKV